MKCKKLKNRLLATAIAALSVTSIGSGMAVAESTELDVPVHDNALPDVDSNPATGPVHTFHLGLWFNSPEEAAKAGCPDAVTPFNGEHNAGVQTSEYRVIAIDLREHGRSTLGSKKLTYSLMAQDVANVMRQLNIRQAAVVGWRDRGNVGLVLAAKYRPFVTRLVAISANFNPSGLTQDAVVDLENQTAESHSAWVKVLYRWQSPQPRRWHELWQQVTAMWKTRPQLTLADLAQIKIPTLLLVGEYDNITPEHTLEMLQAIPNAVRVVLPNTGHSLIRDAPRQVNNVIMRYLANEDVSR